MSGEGGEYRAFRFIFRLPAPNEVIPPVDPADLKVIIQASLTARKLHPQTDVGFDLRFLQQQFGKDPTNLFALWIRSSALERLIRSQQLGSWVRDTEDGTIVQNAVIETGANLSLNGPSFDVDLFLQHLRSFSPES